MGILFPLVLLFAAAAAMPNHPVFNETVRCAGGKCVKPDMKYERIMPSQPGYQWFDAGGYCGSWSIQRATLARGAYISQQQVRDHTSPGGGHDSEILSTNIDEAFKNLKIEVEGFDYNTETVPQQDAYFKWLKKMLVAGNVVTWMIMLQGENYPIYGMTPPAGLYGHVEPVIGIQSNHPLDDETVYDDDVVVHFDDSGTNAVYRVISTLSGDWAGPGSPGVCSPHYSYCIGPYAFGWAIKGFVDDQDGMPASLFIKPSEREPDTRSNETADAIAGKLTVTGLTVGSSYDIYRWDSSDDAFTYKRRFKKTSFKADIETYDYEDPKTFLSNSTTYYKCVPQ